MKFCCASNAAIKDDKIARKKLTFSQNIFPKIAIIFKKYRFLKKHKVHFQILDVLPVILTIYLPV